MDEQDQLYKEHILPISVTDFKALTGRSLQDVTLELLVAKSAGTYDHEESVEFALRQLYSDMGQKGIQDAVCLQLEVCIDRGQFHTTAYAVGLMPKEGGQR